MAANAYHFVTEWTIEGDINEVAAILEDVDTLAIWWPAVYLDVQVTDPGRPGGVGKKVKLFTKGWLPYTLRWDFIVTRSDSPNGFSIAASGDFNGVGVWSLRQVGKEVLVTFDWKIQADKPILKYLSFLMKPLFSANHRWAMDQGEKSIKLEIARRRGQAAPEPPQPTWPHKAKAKVATPTPNASGAHNSSPS